MPKKAICSLLFWTDSQDQKISTRNRFCNYIRGNFAGHPQAENLGIQCSNTTQPLKQKWCLCIKSTCTAKLMAVTHQPLDTADSSKVRMKSMALKDRGILHFCFMKAVLSEAAGKTGCENTGRSLVFPSRLTNKRWSQLHQNEDLTYFWFWPEGAQHTVLTKYYLVP